MNENINYTIALVCLTICFLASVGAVAFGPTPPQSALIGLAGVAVGAIAGVVKQPRQDYPPAIQPGERRTAELEAK